MKIQIKRFLAAMIDYACIHILSLMISFGAMYRDLRDAYMTIIVYIVICGLLFTFKDCLFKNASIGKKMMKLKIVCEKPRRLNFVTYAMRAIPLVLLPIELLMVLKDNRRLGDIIAKTWIEVDV